MNVIIIIISCFLVQQSVLCVRIPLFYDAQSPFLRHSAKTSNSFAHDESLVTFSWSSEFLGRLLHQSEIVEIGPRGLRFIQRSSHNYHYYANHIRVSFPSYTSTTRISPSLGQSTNCTPSHLALCQIYSGEGWLLPSEGAWPAATNFNITSNSSWLKDDVLRILADETACHGELQGSGRRYYLENDTKRNDNRSNVYYSVTSCDILQGKLFVVYEKRNESVYVYPQSFGPIAYFLILISATISTGAITYLSKATAQSLLLLSSEENDSTITLMSYIFFINAMSSIVVCASIFARNKIHFHTLEDSVVFWTGIASGFFYGVIVLTTFISENNQRRLSNHQDEKKSEFLVLPLTKHDDNDGHNNTLGPDYYNYYYYHSKIFLIIIRHSSEMDCCMYALETISIALYRTPENPYASIIAFFMACRIWAKVFLFCHGRTQYHHDGYSQNDSQTIIMRVFDTVLSVINFNLICEYGMKQQYIFRDVWPFYFMTIVFITYCLVKYQWMIAVTALSF